MRTINHEFIFFFIVYILSVSLVQAFNEYTGSLDFHSIQSPKQDRLLKHERYPLDWRNVNEIRVVGDDGLVQRHPLFPILDEPITIPHPATNRRRRERMKQIEALQDIDSREYTAYRSSLLPELWNALTVDPYVPINGFVERRIITPGEMALDVAIRETRAKLLEAMFRSPVLEVEQSIMDLELYILFFSSLGFIIWILRADYKCKNAETYSFDVIQLVPASLQAKPGYKFFIQLICGDPTEAIESHASRVEQLFYHFKSIIKSFAFFGCVMALVTNHRALEAFFIISLMLISGSMRVLQSSCLSPKEAESLASDYLRLPVILQQEYESKMSMKEKKGLNISPGEAKRLDSKMAQFLRDLRIAEYVAPSTYIKILYIMAILAFACALIENFHRIIRLDFREYYRHPASFTLAYYKPQSSFVLELVINSSVFTLILQLIKIPAITLFVLDGCAKSADFFLNQFPLLAPYAFAGRSQPESTGTGINRWLSARSDLLNRCRMRFDVGFRGSNILYACFIFYLLLVFVICHFSSFLVFDEIGMSFTLIGITLSALLTLMIYQGEKANHILHNKQEAVFWDCWARIPHLHLEKRLVAYYYQGPEWGEYTIKAMGVSLRPYSALMMGSFLCWVWGYIIYQSLNCHYASLERLVD